MSSFVVSSWRRARYVLAAGLFVVAAPSLVTAQPVSQLVMWLTPTDAEYFRTGKELPTVADQNRFFDNLQQFFLEEHRVRLSPGVHVEDIRRKTRLDPRFASQVLGQRLIFIALSDFLNGVRGREFRGDITVRFLDWEELLGILENPAAGPSQQADIIIAPSTWIAHLANRQVLAPLDGVDRRVYLETALATCEVRLWPDGDWLPWTRGSASRIAHAFAREVGSPKLYALPWQLDLRFYYFWKDRFPPTARFENLDRFIAALRLAHDSQPADAVFVPPFAIPSAADWDLLHSFSLFLWGMGGDWMQDSRSFVPEGSARNVVALLNTLSADELVSFPRALRAEVEETFLQRRVSSLVAGPWMSHRLRTLGIAESTVGVELPPFNRTGEQATYIGGLHLGLTPRGVSHPYARALLDYVTNDAVMSWATEGAAIPGARGAFNAYLGSLTPASPLRDLIPAALNRARHYPAIPTWATNVEAQATRIDLFLTFKHLAEGKDQDVLDADVRALVGRLTDEIYWEPRFAVGLPILAGIAALVALYVARWSWRRLRHSQLKSMLAQVVELARGREERRNDNEEKVYLLGRRNEERDRIRQELAEALKEEGRCEEALKAARHKSHQMETHPDRSGPDETDPSSREKVEGLRREIDDLELHLREAVRRVADYREKERDINQQIRVLQAQLQDFLAADAEQHARATHAAETVETLKDAVWIDSPVRREYKSLSAVLEEAAATLSQSSHKGN